MAQQDQRGHGDEHGRHSPRLAALAIVAMVTGLAAALLAARGARIVQSLPTSRVEVYLEVLVLAVGAVLAARVALTSTLALVCVVAQSIGRRWRTGERLVLRHAPAAVRRLAGIGISLSVGAGMALGAGAAQAAELPPSDDSTNGSLVVDLGWQPTATDGSIGDAGHLPAGPTDDSSVSVPPATPAPSPDVRSSTSAETPSPLLSPPAGQEPSSVPAPVPGEAASRSMPTASEQAPSAAGQPPASPTQTWTVTEPPPVAQPQGPAHSTPPSAHVPLGELLGSPGRAATSSLSAVSDPAAPAPSVVEIVVLRGDTLWALAERSLGPEASDAQVAAECRRWFDANRDVIGDDPDLIRPGQILSAPTSP